MIFCAKLWPEPIDRMNDSLGPHTGPYAHQCALNSLALLGATGRSRSAMPQERTHLFICLLQFLMTTGLTTVKQTLLKLQM